MLGFRAWPGGGRPETRLVDGSSACDRWVCSEMLCADRWSTLRGEVGPEQCKVLYEGPLMELRGRCVGGLLGAGMSR
jgi:hypothetical protein